MIEGHEVQFLRRAVALAREALDAGDQPFGSVLVSGDGVVLAEDRNRVAGGDPTRHPEFALAQWAATNLPPAVRRAATVYTSGEHCPMCAAAHGWAGLGRIVYATSARTLVDLLKGLGMPPLPVAALPIQEIAPDVTVVGPVDALVPEIEGLYRLYFGRVPKGLHGSP